MTLPEKIQSLMLQNNIKNKKKLAEQSGIPYTTIISLFSKSYKNVTMPTVEKLSKFFGVSLDYLCDEAITDPNYGLAAPEAPALAPDEHQLVEDYRTFNDEGKEKIRDYVSDLKGISKYKKCSESRLDKEA